MENVKYGEQNMWNEKWEVGNVRNEKPKKWEMGEMWDINMKCWKRKTWKMRNGKCDKPDVGKSGRLEMWTWENYEIKKLEKWATWERGNLRNEKQSMRNEKWEEMRNLRKQ